jgi:predicted ATPase/DNA-binding CsgD family transcriptional regulator
MTQTSPIIQDGILTYQLDGQPAQVVVDSADWYGWLETASTFTFRSEDGSFTAHKERAGNWRGRAYWRAYRTQQGQLQRMYLGQSEALTLHQLQSVAARLFGRRVGETVLAVQAQNLEGAPRPPAASSAPAHLRRGMAPSFQGPAGLEETQPEEESVPPGRSTLPVPLTSFLGREREVAAVAALLRQTSVRLVTLLGTGGIGKTRLSLEVANQMRTSFANGICFVTLASISDPDMVMLVIAHELGIQESGTQPIVEQVKTFLQDKQILLILDNFEQVVTAAPQVAELLAACTRLKVMVTSRATLHIQGEQEFPVPALALPDLAHLPRSEELAQYGAAALFLQRARASLPTFQFTPATARAVAEICVRLDGLPLAIELAAARIKLLPPQALLARLSQRLQILTSEARDVPARQQTLRNTITWSYDLLKSEEQWLFRWLSVFVGGCTLEAIEAVCQGGGDNERDVLHTVSSLIDKSLVQQAEQEAGDPRLSMLETVREYGLECLRESGEMAACQRAHARYYLAFAEEAEPQLKGAQQVVWWKRLEREQGNLRAALAWLIGQEEGELALRLSGALWRFWNIRGYWSEGWRWLEAALDLPQTQARTASRAKALFGADTFALRLGHPIASLLEESVAIYRELGEKHSLAEVLSWLGLSMSYQSNLAAARMPLEEGVALAREVGDPWILANALLNLGAHWQEQGNFKQARLFLEESVTLYRALKDQHSLSHSLCSLIEVALSEGQVMQAATLAQENLAVVRELENGPDLTRVLYWAALTQAFQGDTGQAARLFEECLALAREQDNKRQIGSALLSLGGIVLNQGDLLRAETCLQESLTLLREVGTKSQMAVALTLQAEIRLLQGNLTQARAIGTEAVLRAREIEHHYGLGVSLIALAKVSAAEGQAEQAARLFGAAEPRLNPRTELDPFERADYERVVEAVRARLGEKVFAALWAEGRAMTPEQALAAQEPVTMPEKTPAGPQPTTTTKTSLPHSAGLTTREVEVLQLVALGLTNTQVAEQLVVSPRTVNFHLTSIYSKLQVSSRGAAIRYAIEHHLV